MSTSEWVIKNTATGSIEYTADTQEEAGSTLAYKVSKGANERELVVTDLSAPLPEKPRKRRSGTTSKMVFQEDHCWLCGRGTIPGEAWTRDHVVPVSRGGTNARDNLRLAHGTCNGIKGSEDITPELIWKILRRMEQNYGPQITDDPEA